MQNELFRNSLLQKMDPRIISRLGLRRIDLPVLQDLETAGGSIEHLYFLEAGIASMTTCFVEGVQVETSMFGYESAIGVSALMGVRHSFNRIAMMLAGHGYTCRVAAAVAEFQLAGMFQHLLLGSVQGQLTISTQVAACNATHSYEQRLARWLLICSDRANQDTLVLAQEYVSEMLGSTRSTISIAAARLKAKGLIDYRRGTIMLMDKLGLEAEACECYRVVRNHLENLRHFNSGLLDQSKVY